jgi:eukaryotic-like serine/threonine-protein kinase
MWIPDSVLEHVREVSDEPDLSLTKYRLVRAVGRGGMGTVYAAQDTELGREVALKVSIGAGSAEAIERLRNEARVVARLEHPGIVPVHDVGTLPDGRVFYAMKLVRGERLDAWAERPSEVRAVLSLFQRIGEAVAFAHAHSVLHRDLKPENIMVGAFGEALVMDWGIARDLDVESAWIEPGAVVGTEGYMAPEQARGETVDVRADVYGLGAVLSFLLRGRDVPAPLTSICAKATAENPEDRYASAIDLIEDVRRFLDGSAVRAHNETVFERLARFAGRHRVILYLAAAYLLTRLAILLATR